MAERYSNTEIVVIWKAKRRFEWNLLDGDLLIGKGEQASVTLARASGRAALAAVRHEGWIG